MEKAWVSPKGKTQAFGFCAEPARLGGYLQVRHTGAEAGVRVVPIIGPE